MLSRLRGLCASVPCLVVACFLMLSGGLVSIYWKNIYSQIVKTSIQLSPGGARFQAWKDTPVPIYIEFYFFNWTNSDELQIEGKKPSFQEIGPYRFRETKEKTDIVWNANNDTISFKMLRRWYFDPENSNGSLSDELTTINIVALSAAYVLRDWNYYLLLPFSQISKSHPIAITHTISEFLFEGFDDPLIKLGKLGSVFDKAIKLPFDKFGWFYSRNGSIDADGSFNMATGASDISQMGDMKEWNHENWTSFYPDTCGRVTGSTGELFPPNLDKEKPIEVYSQELCRPMVFDYTRDVSISDIKAYEYTASVLNIDNGTLDLSNTCYCGGQCVPSGVVNVSACKYGAPTFVSYPHFYQADPYYLEQVEGLKPDKEKHSFHVYLEPTTGVPLDILARLQVNILIQPYPSIALFSKMPKVYFPMLWFQQRATVTPDLAMALRMLLLLSPVGQIAAIVIFAVGMILFMITAFTVVYRRQHLNASEMKQSANINAEYVSPLMDERDIALSVCEYSDTTKKRRDSKSKIEIIRKKITCPSIAKI